MEYSPRNPKAEDDVTVKVTVESATSIVDAVFLSYEADGNSEEILMTKIGSYYEGIIPSQSDGTKVTVKVYAIDHEEIIAEENFEYVVGQGLEFPPYFMEAAIIGAVIFLLVVFLALANE